MAGFFEFGIQITLLVSGIEHGSNGLNRLTRIFFKLILLQVIKAFDISLKEFFSEGFD